VYPSNSLTIDPTVSIHPTLSIGLRGLVLSTQPDLKELKNLFTAPVEHSISHNEEEDIEPEPGPEFELGMELTGVEWASIHATPKPHISHHRTT
jgi:hypothetical protein